MYALCTVDIWDTLLRRKCHPEAIKLAVAQHLILRNSDLLLPEMRDPWRLYEARLEAELTIAQRSRETGKDDEYELRDVFEFWLGAVCPALADAERDTLVSVLREHELQVEIENTYPDEGILSALQEHPAERVLYLSDFYMASDLLDRLLAHHGFDKVLSGGVVSCDVGLNKRSGNLFGFIQEREGIPGSAHIHIGDNPHSDVDMPEKYGIKGVLYQPPEPHAARIARESLFASRNVLYTHVLSEIAAKAEDAAPAGNDTEHGMFLLGVQSAPLFIGLSLYVAERARLDQLDLLCFLTREGIFFRRVFEALFPDGQHAGLPLPPVTTLSVSRMATFLGSLNDVSVSELNRIWRLNDQQRVSALLDVLCLDLDTTSPILARHDLSADTVLRTPKDDPRVHTLFQDPDFNALAMESARTRRLFLESYLVQNGVPKTGRVGVIDIGWRGTIQDNLARIVPDAHISGYYLALRKFLNPQVGNVEKNAYVLDEKRDDIKHLFESFEPLELLCNSASGSTVAYERQPDGTVVPVREEHPSKSSIVDAYVRHFQDGVAFAAAHWAPSLSAYAVSAQELRSLALNVWNQIANTPSSKLVEAYYASPQHDLFGFGDLFDRAEVPSLGALVLGLVHRDKRHEVINYIRRTQWSTAVHELRIGRIHKMALLTVLNAAKLYKRLVLMRKS